MFIWSLWSSSYDTLNQQKPGQTKAVKHHFINLTTSQGGTWIPAWARRWVTVWASRKQWRPTWSRRIGQEQMNLEKNYWKHPHTQAWFKPWVLLMKSQATFEWEWTQSSKGALTSWGFPETSSMVDSYMLPESIRGGIQGTIHKKGWSEFQMVHPSPQIQCHHMPSPLLVQTTNWWQLSITVKVWSPEHTRRVFWKAKGKTQTSWSWWYGVPLPRQCHPWIPMPWIGHMNNKNNKRRSSKLLQ